MVFGVEAEVAGDEVGVAVCVNIDGGEGAPPAGIGGDWCGVGDLAVVVLREEDRAVVDGEEEVGVRVVVDVGP